MSPIRKLLVANRGEIAIRVCRSAVELGLRTVAVYTHEDRYALHRLKADEAYLIGVPGEPVKSYLDIDELLRVSTDARVDAVHPGYGFLSENAQFARECHVHGIQFVGPDADTIETLGDKVRARDVARRLGIPVLGGSAKPPATPADAEHQALELGYPVILKAVHGGGGRGMRVVRAPADLPVAFDAARSEAAKAFGSDQVFLEKFVERAKHIEVQVLGDAAGNVVHLGERDCSVQRRHQKIIEIAPSPALDSTIREALCYAAVSLAKELRYHSAGTVEFLVDVDSNDFYFIEVNPRIQVEHTVTEEVTGIDLIKAQILIAGGHLLATPEIGIRDQHDIQFSGFALQCRITSEDPTEQFRPDHGRITHYRSAAGPGIRLDAGSAFTGAIVTPYYDSLLVKVTARGQQYTEAVSRMHRALREFRVRGLHTNLAFLMNLLRHPVFASGECATRFIDETPELFEFELARDRATRLIHYIGNVVVNGNNTVAGRPRALRRAPASVPDAGMATISPGYRDRLRELGADAFCRTLKDHSRLLITDTTFRDAHQSLFATRMRTYDMLQVADAYARLCPDLFSIEMWGGATFDTSMRFLKECPWQRLVDLRERIPNILFQMLLRGSSVVGYSRFPDKVVKSFVSEAAAAGIDLFRIFDALNWLPNVRAAMEATLEAGAICEAAICYTGDITDPERTKYTLDYYVGLAKELERMGAHLLAVKDMAGLCKPEAARLLFTTLKQEIGIPIHFHTHDTSGIQAASVLNAADAGVEIVDLAFASMSGVTSQPNLNTLVEAMRFHRRATDLDTAALDAIADYWRAVREFYLPFASETLPATADLYRHEIPGGQYTNLYQQARELGLADDWHRVCEVYARVNNMFGDLVKVTPTSKAIGDMALFMVVNDLSCDDVLQGEAKIDFPQSIIDLVSGNMGQPYGGFPEGIKERILGTADTSTEGEDEPTLPDLQDSADIPRLGDSETRTRDQLSYALYPRVFEELCAHLREFGDTSCLPTPVFFYGLEDGEEVNIEIEKGKTLIVKLIGLGTPNDHGERSVFFELSGQLREAVIRDTAVEPVREARTKADPGDHSHIGAGMPGVVSRVGVAAGDAVRETQPLLSLEAMKMETTVSATRTGVVSEVHVKAGDQVEAGDLLVELR